MRFHNHAQSSRMALYSKTSLNQATPVNKDNIFFKQHKAQSKREKNANKNRSGLIM